MQTCISKIQVDILVITGNEMLGCVKYKPMLLIPLQTLRMLIN